MQCALTLLFINQSSIQSIVPLISSVVFQDNLVRHRPKITGMDSLRKVKIGDRLIQQDLNVHFPPKQNLLRQLGIEL